MLHRKTYDALSDTGTVLHWEVTPAGGFIVVQDAPTVFTVWREGWDESLQTIAQYDIKRKGVPYAAESFGESQQFGREIVQAVLADSGIV